METPRTGHSRPSAWLLAGWRVPAAVAASVAILAVAASFWLGITVRTSAVSLTVLSPAAPPPAPAFIAVPAAVVPGNRLPRVMRTADGGHARQQLPKPMRVLRFVPGVDWISTPE